MPGSVLTYQDVLDLKREMDELMKPTWEPSVLFPNGWREPAKFGGMSVYELPRPLRKQFRFPKSKKRRIRKKWAKRVSNFRPVASLFMADGNKILAGPSEIVALRNLCRRS
jgi:hypothetical protein